MKTKFMMKSVEYFSHVIDTSEHLSFNVKIKATKEVPEPTNGTKFIFY